MTIEDFKKATRLPEEVKEKIFNDLEPFLKELVADGYKLQKCILGFGGCQTVPPPDKIQPGSVYFDTGYEFVGTSPEAFLHVYHQATGIPYGPLVSYDKRTGKKTMMLFDGVKFSEGMNFAHVNNPDLPAVIHYRIWKAMKQAMTTMADGKEWLHNQAWRESNVGLYPQKSRGVFGRTEGWGEVISNDPKRAAILGNLYRPEHYIHFFHNGNTVFNFKQDQSITSYEFRKEGVIHGPRLIFNTGGNLVNFSQFEDGQENGLCYEFFDNGQTRSEKVYQSGRLLKRTEWEEPGAEAVIEIKEVKTTKQTRKQPKKKAAQKKSVKPPHLS